MKFDPRIFEDLYAAYNRREFVHPDPLEFLYDYEDPREREIVGLVASSLAYGRVAQILRSVSDALGRMSKSPHEFVMGSSEGEIVRAFRGFRHRFTAGRDLSRLLIGAKGAIVRHGSLCGCFNAGLESADPTIVPALAAFVERLAGAGADGLLPHPARGSACKRLNLFLRWMVRRDAVDPGGWTGIPRSKLIVPLDTHMYRIGVALEFTKRRAADMRTAIEITAAFSRMSPDDPVKYDFALTRLGIRSDIDKKKLAAVVGHAGFEPATR